jgi:F-box-like
LLTLMAASAESTQKYNVACAHQCTLMHVDDVILIKILRHLCERDLCMVKSTCRRFYRVASDACFVRCLHANYGNVAFIVDSALLEREHARLVAGMVSARTETLNLQDCMRLRSADVASLLAVCWRRLKVLNMSGCLNAGGASVPSTMRLPRLETFIACNHRASLRPMLDKLAIAAPDLRELVLAHSQLVNADDVAMIVRSFAQLRVLDVSGCSTSAVQAAVDAAVERRIERVYSSHTDLLRVLNTHSMATVGHVEQRRRAFEALVREMKPRSFDSVALWAVTQQDSALFAMLAEHGVASPNRPMRDNMATPLCAFTEMDGDHGNALGRLMACPSTALCHRDGWPSSIVDMLRANKHKFHLSIANDYI